MRFPDVQAGHGPPEPTDAAGLGMVFRPAPDVALGGRAAQFASGRDPLGIGSRQIDRTERRVVPPAHHGARRDRAGPRSSGGKLRPGRTSGTLVGGRPSARRSSRSPPRSSSGPEWPGCSWVRLPCHSSSDGPAWRSSPRSPSRSTPRFPSRIWRRSRWRAWSGGSTTAGSRSSSWRDSCSTSAWRCRWRSPVGAHGLRSPATCPSRSCSGSRCTSPRRTARGCTGTARPWARSWRTAQGSPGRSRSTNCGSW